MSGCEGTGRGVGTDYKAAGENVFWGDENVLLLACGSSYVALPKFNSKRVVFTVG